MTGSQTQWPDLRPSVELENFLFRVALPTQIFGEAKIFFIVLVCIIWKPHEGNNLAIAIWC